MMTRAKRRKRKQRAYTAAAGSGFLWGLLAVSISLLSTVYEIVPPATRNGPLFSLICFPFDLSSAILFLPISFIQPLYIPGTYLGTWHIIIVSILALVLGISLGWGVGSLLRQKHSRRSV